MSRGDFCVVKRVLLEKIRDALSESFFVKVCPILQFELFHFERWPASKRDIRLTSLPVVDERTFRLIKLHESVQNSNQSYISYSKSLSDCVTLSM